MRTLFWAAAAVCASYGQVLAAPSEDVLRDDLVRGLLDVCLPAQTKNMDARTYLKGPGKKLRLRRVHFANTTRERAWALSSDRRAHVFGKPDQCMVSAEVRREEVGSLVEDLHEELSALSAAEPSAAGEFDSGRFAVGYCALLTDGSLGSYNFYGSVGQMEAATGSRVGGETQMLFIVAPRLSECAASE